MLYVFEGSLETVNESKEPVEEGHIVLFDANSEESRGIELATSKGTTAKALLFAGKKLREPIAWHGPIVMNSQEQIVDTLRELRSGNFPPVLVPWNYKRMEDFPNAAEK